METIIKQALLDLADEQNAATTAGLIPTEHKPVLGIRMPILRNYAENIVKIRRYNEYLVDEATDEYLEETLLRGLIIGYFERKRRCSYIFGNVGRIPSTY